MASSSSDDSTSPSALAERGEEDATRGARAQQKQVDDSKWGKDDVIDMSNDGDDDDNEGVGEEGSDQDDVETHILGGSISTPAFALLTGVFIDPDDSSSQKFLSIPLTRLPATLGRSHKTSDPNFFGLGERRNLSRQHCRIFYQDALGGTLNQTGKSDEITYQPPLLNHSKNVIRANEDKPLPQTGFFVMECLGKNRISVDKKRVEQGEVALLENGAAIRMNTYCLYFLLPTNAAASTLAASSTKPTMITSTLQRSSPEGKKRPAPKLASSAPPAAKRSKKTSAGGLLTTTELEALPVEELLATMTEAIQTDQWDRRHQMIGSAISVHAVKSAARSKIMRKMAKSSGGGLSRSDIMAWIKNSPTYSEWVNQMLSKMEIKSYHSNVSKALIRAGFVRTGTTGRHVKWLPPPLGNIDDNDEEDGDDEVGNDGSNEGDASDDDEESESGDGGNNNDESSDEDGGMPSEWHVANEGISEQKQG